MTRNKLRKEKELNQIKKSTNVFFNIIFIILSALCIFPIVFVFSISISSETSIQKNGYQLIPQELSAAAYQFLWNERGTISCNIHFHSGYRAWYYFVSTADNDDGICCFKKYL